MSKYQQPWNRACRQRTDASTNAGFLEGRRRIFHKHVRIERDSERELWFDVDGEALEPPAFVTYPLGALVRDGVRRVGLGAENAVSDTTISGESRVVKAGSVLTVLAQASTLVARSALRVDSLVGSSAVLKQVAESYVMNALAAAYVRRADPPGLERDERGQGAVGGDGGVLCLEFFVHDLVRHVLELTNATGVALGAELGAAARVVGISADQSSLAR